MSCEVMLLKSSNTRCCSRYSLASTSRPTVLAVDDIFDDLIAMATFEKSKVEKIKS